MSEWIDISDDLPERGQHVWLYDSMFGSVDSAIIAFDPQLLDGDFTHWQPKLGYPKPAPPVDGKVHAAGYPR